jgi:hypothetical protein
MSATKESDKTWDGATVESYGKIRIRVVVLHRKHAGEEETPSEVPAAGAGDEDPIITGKTPLDSYLERPEHGKQCVVFLVAGQRHDALDNTFLARELNFKYLRSRTMVIVDLDGLEQEAIGEIVQGSRQGLYRGAVYQAIVDRLFATLKNDPDLKRLQEEAEQEISELESGDEAVRKKLDQLIDSHHTAAPRAALGEVEPGHKPANENAAFGKDKKQPVVVKDSPDRGEVGEEPLLVSDAAPTLRILPDGERTISLRAQPEEAWADLELLEARAAPAVPELSLTLTRADKAAKLTMRFEETEDSDPEAYPVEATVSVFAKFKGHKEPRLVIRNIRVAPSKPRPPKKKIELKPTPTFLRIATRQPVRMVEGAASTHVRVRWDGQDELASGTGAEWKFVGRCPSLETFPPITFSAPREGVFEMLLDSPHGLIPGAQLEFELEANGPGGAQLKAAFKAEVVAAPPRLEPRKINTEAPETTAQRRPPYELRYVKEETWPGACWNDEDFTADDVGCFKEPTDTKPLILILNDDAALLKEFRENMVTRKLEEATVKDRLTKYNSHVSFHLYQMYNEQKRRNDEREKLVEPDDLRAEINRVGSTLIRVMEVSR